MITSRRKRLHRIRKRYTWGRRPRGLPWYPCGYRHGDPVRVRACSTRPKHQEHQCSERTTSRAVLLMPWKAVGHVREIVTRRTQSSKVTIQALHATRRARISSLSMNASLRCYRVLVGSNVHTDRIPVPIPAWVPRKATRTSPPWIHLTDPEQALPSRRDRGQYVRLPGRVHKTLKNAQKK